VVFRELRIKNAISKIIFYLYLLKQVEDINDDYPIRMIDIDLSNDPLQDQMGEIINKLNAPEGMSLKEIKELTWWNDENLAENMNTYLNCNLTMILQAVVTDDFRIRHSQD